MAENGVKISDNPTLASADHFLALSEGTSGLLTAGALGTLVAAQSAIAGRFGGVYHVDLLGVDTTGTSDVSAAVAALLSAISTAGGGVLQFGGGTYLFSAAVSIPNNVIIRGVGKTRSILKSSTADINIFEGASNAPVVNATFEDLGFQGQEGQTIGASQAIRVRAYRDLTIRRCKFISFQVAAVIVGVDATDGTEVYENFRFYENDIDGGGVNIPFSGVHTYNGDGVWIERNYIWRVARAIDFEQNGNSYCRRAWVLFNKWEQCRLSSWANPDSLPTIEYTNTYHGIHFATDPNSTTQGFDTILIDGNVSIRNTSDNGSGGVAENNGFDINLDRANWEEVADSGHDVEVRRHSIIQPTHLTEESGLPARLINVNGLKAPIIKGIRGEDPQNTGIYLMRLRDSPRYYVDGIKAIDGDSIAFDRPIAEVRSTALAAPMLGTRGKIEGTGTSTLLNPFAEGVLDLSGRARVSGGNVQVQTTTADNVVASHTFTKGTLRIGSLIRITATGRFEEINGAKNIGIYRNGVSIGKWAPTTADDDGFKLSCEFNVPTATTYSYATWLQGLGAVAFAESDAGGNGNWAPATDDLTLALVAWVANAADKIVIRNYQFELIW